MIADHRQTPLLVPDTNWRPPTELPNLRGVTRLAFDVETRDEQLTELGPGVRRGGHIVGMSLGTNDGRRWYLPIRHEGGGNLDADVVLAWARSELNAFDGELVGANLLYDLDFSAHEGIAFPKVRRFFDVQVAEPLLDEHRREYNLDSLSRDYLHDNKREEVLKAAAIAYGFGTSAKAVKGNIWRLPAQYVGEYGEADADLPLRILPLQLAKIEDEGLGPVFDLESRLIPVLLAMRRRGVRIDIGKVDSVRARLVQERDEALTILRSFAGPQAELRAPDSFSKALLDRGLQFSMTKEGHPSITKPWLEKHIGDPLIDSIIRGRTVDTIINTFIDGHIRSHLIGNRIHCQFHQLRGDDSGTIARLSSDSPNLQNIPARNKILAPLIRSLFLPEEDEKWASCDLSQTEYRILTHYAVGPRAEEARQMYRDNPKTDFHNMCASMLGFDPQNNDQRTRVKSTNFCKVYGGGAPKIAQTFGCSLAEATAFVEKYDRELPFVKATSDLAMKTAIQRGYVRTIYGRRQRFSFWEPQYNKGRLHKPLLLFEAKEKYGSSISRAYTYAALNRVIQGSAADQMKKAMVDVHESGVCDTLGAMLLTVHDELDVSVPQTAAGQEAIMELKRLMEDAIPLSVPVIGDLKIANHWGECKT